MRSLGHFETSLFKNFTTIKKHKTLTSEQKLKNAPKKSLIRFLVLFSAFSVCQSFCEKDKEFKTVLITSFILLLTNGLR